MKKNILLISSIALTAFNILSIIIFKINILFAVFFFIIPIIMLCHVGMIYSISYSLTLVIALNIYFYNYKNLEMFEYKIMYILEFIYILMSVYFSKIYGELKNYKSRIEAYNDLIDYTEKREEDTNFYENIIKYTLKKFNGENVEFLLVNSDRIVKKIISSSKEDVYKIENQLKEKKNLYRKVLEGEKFCINNIKTESNLIVKTEYKKLMMVPVHVGDETFGILKIESNLRKKYSKKNLEDFYAYSKILGFIIENHEFYEMGLYDELLEIPTERYVQKKMEQIFDENKNSSILYSVALIDIDNFKKINEFYGSINGDIILKESLKIIKRKISKDDFIGRITGNRFIIILENRGKYISKNFLEELREEYSKKSFFIKQRKESLTFSVGLASLPIDNVKNYSELKELLESRLYKAKLSGKNHIIEF